VTKEVTSLNSIGRKATKILKLEQHIESGGRRPPAKKYSFCSLFFRFF